MKTVRTRIVVLAALALALVAALGFATLVSANGAAPVLVAGNPSCTDLGYDFGFKPQPEPPPSGTYTFPAPDGVNTVSITSNGTYFDWVSTLGIDAVIVKGGPNANLYSYDPEAFSGSGLHSPTNPNNNQPFSISHIEFCYDYEVTVSKTAMTSYTRTHAWDIDKAVTPGEWHLFTGDSGTSEYTVSVTKTGYTDSYWAVSGGIKIENLTPFDATITSVTDVVSGGINAPVTCGVTFPYVLPAGGTLNCTYSTPLPNASARVNTATVTTSGIVGGGVATADVTFGAPTTVVNDSINVDDTNGASWAFAGSGSVSYQQTFTCDGDEGTHNNTATIRETGQSDSASVTVTCYQLDVSKDAATTFDRTWNWSIDKSVTPASWDLFTGDSGTSKYTVSVDKVDYTDSNFAVSGTITVANNTPLNATLNGVADVVSPDVAAVVDCGAAVFPYDLAAGGSLVCTYSTALPDAATRLNTGTATIQNYDYDPLGAATTSGTTGFSGTANVAFDDTPDVVHDAEINVNDTNGMSWGPVADDASWEYEKTFSCDGDEGTHGNMATIVETGQSDDASVTVNCYELEVTKNATTTFTRKYLWEIDKWADQSELLLSNGQQHTVNYSVMVGVVGHEDSAWAVNGIITVNNPAPIVATINDVTDVVSPDIAAVVDCGVSFPTAVAAGGTLNCTYSTPLSDATTRKNVATATLQNYSYNSLGVGVPAGTKNFTGKAVVAFGGPTTELDTCVEVTDTNVGALGTVCVGEAPVTFSYPLVFGAHPDADVVLVCGYNEHPNTAKFVTNDTGATGEDTWKVIADVACEVGCTLTPGYWKTHSDYGPAPYDDTWALLLPLGPDNPFFSSGQTYYEVLWTPPQGGNAYYILAHAYIAAEMNMLNGASVPGEVQDAFDAATVLFQTYSPEQVDALKGKNGKETRAEFVYLAGLLDDYNNGYTGPGHCSE